MCLSVPAKVTAIRGDMATVNIGGIELEASILLVDSLKVGDYVLLHAGFAIQKLNEDEANETIKLLRELGESWNDQKDEINRQG